MKRREFLKTGALAAAATSLVPGAFAKQAARDRIRVGILGSGARAQELMRSALEIPGVELAAVCDAYQGRAEQAKEIAGSGSRIHPDYREILDRSDIDVVFIGSPDHWHRQMSLDALAAGKDVYTEKPMTYEVDEGLEIVVAAKKSDRIYQVGSQGVSSATQIKAKELIQSGALGQVTLIRASYNRNTAGGAWIYPIPPDASERTVDWGKFLGPAPKHPFSLERFFRWRCYWDYSGGIATDLFVHLVTTIHFVMNAKMPETIMASGQLYRWKESRDVPDTVNAILVYPEGFTVNLSSTFNNQSSRESGFEILGTRGAIAFRGGSLVYTPENLYEDNRWVVESWKQELAEAYYEDPDVQARETPETWTPEMKSSQQTWDQWGRNATVVHLAHFFDSVRSRKPSVQDALTGHRAASVAHLINASLKREAPVRWDFAGEKMQS
ncbi:MAG TPA: Gfo/Idh/MocA family oxidoreductase [Vicinamibacteria bacterium]|nr:Gfo/Idh/MocA family oxidoreductase [Vicinamibacteria bacterium]